MSSSVPGEVPFVGVGFLLLRLFGTPAPIGFRKHCRTPLHAALLLLMDSHMLAFVLSLTQLITPITMGACPSLQHIPTEPAPHQGGIMS